MKKLKDWFQEQKITEVECIIPDLTGIARGKIMPADKLLRNEGLRMPEAVFLQSVTGEWIPYENLFDVDPAEIDMQLRPDPLHNLCRSVGRRTHCTGHPRLHPP